MNKEDIIKLARESYERGQSDLAEACKEASVKAIVLAVLAEREACAQVAEGFDACDPKHIAAAIRARGQE